MNVILKSTWTVLILGAAVGCAGDTETETPVPATNTVPTVSQPAGETPKDTAPKAATAPVPSGDAKATDEKKADEKPKDTAPKEATAPVPSGKATDEKKADEKPKVEGPKADNSKPGSGAVTLTADELASIKELPASEQDAARAQLTCPVSSEHLGSMGKPLKVTAEGKTFYLCCESCQKDLKANPRAVVAKLDQKKPEK